MMRPLAIMGSVALAGCAGTVDWSQVGASQAQQAQNSAEVVACDQHITAVAKIFPHSDAASGSPQWRIAMRQRMGMFDACMRSKGWTKLPVIGWLKATDEMPTDDRGGD